MVADGAGTWALVAGIAAVHGLSFLVISAGTRNRFAPDLGLARDGPATCLDALTSGEELRLGPGTIGGRTFVNNASFGAYAEVVKSPAYRDDKRSTAPRSARHACRARVGVPSQAESPVTGARSAVAQGWGPLRKSEHG